MKTLLLLLAGFLVLLTGCSPLDSTIDASSPEAYQKSLQSIRAKLKPDELKKFEDSLTIVAMNDILPKDGGLFALLAGAANPEKLQAQMLASVNGKTPRQIIESATAIRKLRAQAELKRVTEELAALEKQKAEAATSAHVLDKIVVSEPKYYVEQNSFISQPILDFKVRNDTTLPLARVYYHGTLSTPGRSIPWIDADFNHEIAGGLEPGEVKHLRLQPNMFSKWGEREARNQPDAVLTVSVVNAEGVDKKQIAATFGKSEQDRFTTLTRQKTELEATLAEP